MIRWHGTRHRLHYSCRFDRRGRVVDGRFYYYPERARQLTRISLPAPGQPAEKTWQVTDVASNDVLYVHSQALLASPRIGNLPHNAKGVRVYGCEWSDVDQGTWCEVEYNGLRGFAARMYLKEDS